MHRYIVSDQFVDRVDRNPINKFQTLQHYDVCLLSNYLIVSIHNSMSANVLWMCGAIRKRPPRADSTTLYRSFNCLAISSALDCFAMSMTTIPARCSLPFDP